MRVSRTVVEGILFCWLYSSWHMGAYISCMNNRLSWAVIAMVERVHG